jgi:hypothetical protein
VAPKRRSRTRNQTVDRRQYLLISFVFLALAFAAPASAANKPADDNGVPDAGVLTGRVTLSPACPVERMPPDPACAPRRYQTTLRIYGTNDIAVASSQSDARGEFRFSLPAGTYRIEAEGGAMFPRCTAQTATVRPNVTTLIEISCDTGIR